MHVLKWGVSWAAREGEETLQRLCADGVLVLGKFSVCTSVSNDVSLTFPHPPNPFFVLPGADVRDKASH